MGDKSKTDLHISSTKDNTADSSIMELIKTDPDKLKYSDNSDYNSSDTGFITDAKWRDVLELSKGLEQSNDRLASYLVVLKNINIDVNDQKSKIKKIIDDMVTHNKSTIDSIAKTVDEMNLLGGDVLEEHALNYLASINRIDNALCLSTKTETSIIVSIDKLKKGE